MPQFHRAQPSSTALYAQRPLPVMRRATDSISGPRALRSGAFERSWTLTLLVTASSKEPVSTVLLMRPQQQVLREISASAPGPTQGGAPRSRAASCGVSGICLTAAWVFGATRRAGDPTCAIDNCTPTLISSRLKSTSFQTGPSSSDSRIPVYSVVATSVRYAWQAGVQQPPVRAIADGSARFGRAGGWLGLERVLESFGRSARTAARRVHWPGHSRAWRT